MKIRSTQIWGIALLAAGLLLCGYGIFLLVRPAQYAATVTIRVLNDGGIIALTPSKAEYEKSLHQLDRCFIETTYEIMRSQLVLSNVIATLNLNEAWAKKYNHGKKLESKETMKLIQERIRFSHPDDTDLISITFYGDSAKEAAEVANAIAESYRNYRIGNSRELLLSMVKVKEQIFQEEENRIRNIQTNMDLLLRQTEEVNPASTPEQKAKKLQAYSEEKEKFDVMLLVHQMSKARIESVKESLMIIPNSWVLVIKAATPPTSHTSNRPLAVGVILLGLICGIGGWVLLKPSSA